MAYRRRIALVSNQLVSYLCRSRNRYYTKRTSPWSPRSRHESIPTSCVRFPQLRRSSFRRALFYSCLFGLSWQSCRFRRRVGQFYRFDRRCDVERGNPPWCPREDRFRKLWCSVIRCFRVSDGFLPSKKSRRQSYLFASCDSSATYHQSVHLDVFATCTSCIYSHYLYLLPCENRSHKSEAKLLIEVKLYQVRFIDPLFN